MAKNYVFYVFEKNVIQRLKRIKNYVELCGYVLKKNAIQRLKRIKNYVELCGYVFKKKRLTYSKSIY